MSVRLLVLAGMLLFASGADCFELNSFLSDPFDVTPEVLRKGVVLPGDLQPFQRAPSKDFDQPLSLGEAIDLALTHNQRVKGAWADIKVQANALGEVYATYLPLVGGTVSWARDNTSYSESGYESSHTSGFSFQASANWKIFDFGGRSASRNAARHLLTAALRSYDAAIQETLAGVVQAYFDAVTQAASVRARSEEAELGEKILRSAQSREETGVLSRSDTLRAKTALAKSRLNGSRAQGDYEKALAMLRYVLGVSADTGLVLPEEVMKHTDIDGEGRELSNWLEDAKTSHPAVKAAREQLEAAREQVKAIELAGLPSLNLSLSYYRNSRPGQAISAANVTETTGVLSVTLPVFEGFSSSYKTLGGRALAERRAAALSDTEQQVAKAIARSYGDATFALKNLEISETLLDAAQEALAVSRRRYDKGAANMEEVLSAQAALSDARSERIRCIAEWNSARLQLLANAGKLGHQGLQ